MTAARKNFNLMMRTDKKTEELLNILIEEMQVSKSEVVRQAIMQLAKEKIDKERLVEILMRNF